MSLNNIKITTELCEVECNTWYTRLWGSPPCTYAPSLASHTCLSFLTLKLLNEVVPEKGQETPKKPEWWSFTCRALLQKWETIKKITRPWSWDWVGEDEVMPRNFHCFHYEKDWVSTVPRWRGSFICVEGFTNSVHSAASKNLQKDVKNDSKLPQHFQHQAQSWQITSVVVSRLQMV